MTKRFISLIIFTFFGAFALPSPDLCAHAAPVPASQTQTPAAAEDTKILNEILQASQAYFSRFPFMRAEDVYEKIVKERESAYLLVSVQSRDEYSRGHVPGAINIPLAELTGADSLTKLPRNKKIVLTCDNGHRSMMAALLLGQLGYETYAMSMGLSYWNAAGAGIASPYPGSAGYPVSTVNETPEKIYPLPVIDDSGKTGTEEIIERSGSILAKAESLFIDRSEVYAKAVQAGDPGYLLVSLQQPADYARGHVPGAINIPPGEIAKAESLRKLPRGKKIVLICYVGHWGGSAALFLNQLGYEAYDMRFGTLGWNDGTEGLGEAKDYLVTLGGSLNLPVEKGGGD